MKFSARTLAIIATLGAAACGGGDGGTEPVVPAGLAPVSSVTLSAAVGKELTDSLAVRVVDSKNKAMPNVQVSWSVASGGGVLSATSTPTNAQGTAKVAWTLGTVPGENKVTATVGGLSPVIFTATASAGPPATIAVIDGANQSAVVGTPVPVPPSVMVKDKFGNPAAGVQVTFVVGLGGGTLTGATRTTDAAGIATVGSWTLGTQAGTQSISAGSGIIPAARINATALAAAAAQLAVAGGNAQRADAGATVPAAPSVLVKDEFGNVVAGEAVTFTVTAGGGSVTGGTAISDANGRAAVGSWKLGDAGGLNVLEASANSGKVSLFANARPQPRAGYNIDLIYTTLPTPSQIQAVNAAVARWSAIITGELSNISASSSCAGNPVNETVDDMVMIIDFDSIDGLGQVLGSAGPCLLRSSNDLPFLGLLQLDKYDLEFMETAGLLEDVIVHEMGHILGIGTLWCITSNPCENSEYMEGRTKEDPYFIGVNARAAFAEVGGAVYTGIPVPVENEGGPGTRDGHWRESVMKTELMTGFIGTGSNPMSLVTIESLRDMGYTVDRTQADLYTVPEPEDQEGSATAALVHRLELRELNHTIPLYRVEPDGTLRRLR